MTLRITCLSKVVTLLVILLHYFDVGNIPSTVKPPQQQASLDRKVCPEPRPAQKSSFCCSVRVHAACGGLTRTADASGCSYSI